eukprot:g43877.t1
MAKSSEILATGNNRHQAMDRKKKHHRRNHGHEDDRAFEWMGFVEEGEYKGQPMLILRKAEGDRYPFQFGLKKACLIIEHYDDIVKFVEDHLPEEEF